MLASDSNPASLVKRIRELADERERQAISGSEQSKAAMREAAVNYRRLADTLERSVTLVPAGDYSAAT